MVCVLELKKKKSTIKKKKEVDNLYLCPDFKRKNSKLVFQFYVTVVTGFTEQINLLQGVIANILCFDMQSNIFD